MTQQRRDDTPPAAPSTDPGPGPVPAPSPVAGPGDPGAVGPQDLVPGSAGPLERVVERLADGRRLTRYRSPDAAPAADPGAGG